MTVCYINQCQCYCGFCYLPHHFHFFFFHLCLYLCDVPSYFSFYFLLFIHICEMTLTIQTMMLLNVYCSNVFVVVLVYVECLTNYCQNRSIRFTITIIYHLPSFLLSVFHVKKNVVERRHCINRGLFTVLVTLS